MVVMNYAKTSVAMVVMSQAYLDFLFPRPEAFGQLRAC